ncbi:hypothetical protein [Burkholderia pseudomallei]|uniref:hypothetical protein n=1 Tax=Burkholderia pseudomallei TaxID=28450 RepID=UPI0013922A3A|nr:hypothetical protein [Burkholderia pseudomallei]
MDPWTLGPLLAAPLPLPRIRQRAPAGKTAATQRAASREAAKARGAVGIAFGRRRNAAMRATVKSTFFAPLAHARIAQASGAPMSRHPPTPDKSEKRRAHLIS